MKMKRPTAMKEKRTGANRDAAAVADIGSGAHACPARRARRPRREKRARTFDRARARGAADPGQIDNVEEAKRMILTHLRVPLACEEKVCRRALRCVGTVQSVAGRPVIACWERHHDVLQPFLLPARIAGSPSSAGQIGIRG